MSKENVEIARRYLEEHFPGPEQMSEWVGGFWESDGDHYPARKIPGARPCHGREEIAAFLTEFRAAWEGFRYVIEEARATSVSLLLADRRVADGDFSGSRAG